jgi:hypothetical protein
MKNGIWGVSVLWGRLEGRGAGILKERGEDMVIGSYGVV